VVKIPNKWYRYCVNLIYPLKCVVCNLPISLEELKSEFLCSFCLKKIKFIIPPVCEKCGRPSNSPICSECNKKHNFSFEKAFSVALYEGIWKELIHLFKYNKNDRLDKFLAEFLVELILNNPYLKESDSIIPVPLHRWDRWKRGYNQTHLLAYWVSSMTGIPIWANNLIKHKKIPSQTTLSGKDRLKNIKGAFIVKKPKILKNKKVLLIDDVFTTGSTVNECSKVLLEAKASQVNVITLACSC
jgi:competence protein ComFC